MKIETDDLSLAVRLGQTEKQLQELSKKCNTVYVPEPKNDRTAVICGKTVVILSKRTK